MGHSPDSRGASLSRPIAFDQAKHGYLANSVVVGGVRSSVRPGGQLMR